MPIIYHETNVNYFIYFICHSSSYGNCALFMCKNLRYNCRLSWMGLLVIQSWLVGCFRFCISHHMFLPWGAWNDQTVNTSIVALVYIPMLTYWLLNRYEGFKGKPRPVVKPLQGARRMPFSSWRSLKVLELCLRTQDEEHARKDLLLLSSFNQKQVLGCEMVAWAERLHRFKCDFAIYIC